MLRIVIAGVAAAGLLIAPATAGAAEVRASSSGPGDARALEVTYTAAAGEQNSPTFSEYASGATVVDPTATLTSADGSCTISEDGHTATCPDERGLDRVTARLGDGDDTAVIDAELRERGPFFFDGSGVEGGPGDDVLTGSDTSEDRLAGGTGDDTLDGRGGSDVLSDRVAANPGQAPEEGGTNVMRGGAGDDSLSGGPNADQLDGGAGHDVIGDTGGTAVMNGADGDDHFSRSRALENDPPSAAAIDGGAGRDEVGYFIFSEDFNKAVEPTTPGATIRLDAGATTQGNGSGNQDDTLTAVEDATGTPGMDEITGSAVGNDLYGRGGNDKISGGGGQDNLEGGPGADTIDAGDREADRVRCSEFSGGDAGDTAAVDDLDLVDRCPAEGAGTTTTSTRTTTTTTTTTTNQPTPQPAPEIIRRPAPFTPPADTSAPDIAATTLAKTIKLSTLRRRGYRFTVRSADPGAGQVVATLTGRLKSGVRVAAVGDLVVAQRTRTFTRELTLRLRPSAKVRRGLRRGSRLRLVIEVRDPAGNRAVKSARIRVR